MTNRYPAACGVSVFASAIFLLLATPAADAGSHAYISNTLSGTVSVIDVATGAVVGDPIPVGNWPGCIAVSPARSRAYVTDGKYGSIFVIDTTTNTVIGDPTSVRNNP